MTVFPILFLVFQFCFSIALHHTVEFYLVFMCYLFGCIFPSKTISSIQIETYLLLCHILVVLSSFQGRLSESYLLNGWKKTQIPFSICTTQLKVWRRTSLPYYLSVPWFSLWDLYYGIRFKARSWERVWWPLRQLFTIAMASPGWLHTSKSLPGPSRIFQFSLEALGRHWQASTWPTLV